MLLLELAQLGPEILAHLGRVIHHAAVDHGVQSGLSQAAGQRAAGEGGAVGAGGQGVGRVAPGAHRADGHAGAQLLGHGAGVGLHAVVLMGEQLAGTAGANLHLVEHQQDALLIAQIAQALKELLGGGTDAALALNGLGEDGANVVAHLLLHGLQIVELSIAEALGQGGEPLGIVDDLLAGGGGGGQRAAVEGLQHGDDHIALGVAVVHGVLTGQLDLTFVGLGAGVGEEHLLEAAVLADQLTDLDGGLVVVVVGAVHQTLSPIQRLHNGGMVVAQAVDGDAAHKVQELVPVQVPDPSALAVVHHDGHTGVVAVQILVSDSDGLSVALELLDHGNRPPL